MGLFIHIVAHRKLEIAIVVTPSLLWLTLLPLKSKFVWYLLYASLENFLPIDGTHTPNLVNHKQTITSPFVGWMSMDGYRNTASTVVFVPHHKIRFLPRMVRTKRWGHVRKSVESVEGAKVRWLCRRGKRF